jgi:hypothetical protein
VADTVYRKRLDSASVKGFAMIPADVSDLPINQAIKSATSGLKDQTKPWTPNNGNPPESTLVGDAAAFTLTYQNLQQYQTASLHLADPCAQSCRVLFGQLGWDWRQGFAKSVWQAPLGTSADWLKKEKRKGRFNPENVGVGGIGEGVNGRKPPDMTANQMIGNTAETLARPLLSAAAHGVISHVTSTYGK